jgi:hypothetical protein
MQAVSKQSFNTGQRFSKPHPFKKTEEFPTFNFHSLSSSQRLTMPKYNNLSILRKIDQHDLRSLRRVMTGLNHSLEVSKQLLEAKEGLTMYLTADERTWVNRILNAISANGDDYQLLRDAIKRFIKARLAPDKYVIELTKELSLLAEEDVLVVPVGHIKEYEAALKRFHTLPALNIPERRQVSSSNCSI